VLIARLFIPTQHSQVNLDTMRWTLKEKQWVIYMNENDFGKVSPCGIQRLRVTAVEGVRIDYPEEGKD